MSALLGTGTCAHCGAEDVAIADCQETPGQYRREELATMLALAGGAP